MFNLSPIYSACKSSNHKPSKNHKISPHINLHKTKHTQTSNTKFLRISPFGITPVKTHIRLGHAGIMEHSIDLSIPDFHHHPHHHQSHNRVGCWGTTDDFATSFLHFSLFSTALWDLANSRPVHSLMLSSHLFLCLPCLLPPFTVPCKMVLARPDQRDTAVCVSLRWSGGLRVVRLPAESWHGLPRW